MFKAAMSVTGHQAPTLNYCHDLFWSATFTYFISLYV